MYKKLFACALAAAVLAACGDEPEQKTAATLACDSPAVLQSVRANIQEIIKQEAQAFARSDSRKFVDADKIIAAATQLEISLDNPAQESNNGSPVCSAGLSIKIPADIFNTAQTNSPLIYGSQSIAQQLQQRISGSPLNYEQGRFTRPLRYTTVVSDGQTSVNYEDNAVAATAQALHTALLPYGVKSIIMINGQPVPREEALNMGASQPFADPPQADPLDILENNGAASAMPAETPADTGSGDSPEMLSPETPRNNAEFSTNELNQAKRSNQTANSEINRVWNSIDRTIQKELLEEQRAWIQTKNKNCLRAAAQADNPAQASYLQLQCDTRMTRERSQYLRGYSID